MSVYTWIGLVLFYVSGFVASEVCGKLGLYELLPLAMAFLGGLLVEAGMK